MAKTDEVEQALLDKITETIAAVRSPSSAGSHSANDALTVLRLAEAWAWLNRPAQPHGGGIAASG